MVVARRPRRRRPFVAVLALVVTAAAILSALRGGTAGQADARRAWLDQLRPVIEHANEVGADLTSLRREAGRLDRPTLGRRLERMATEARAVLHDAAAIDHPDSLDTARSLVMATLAIRARAIERLGPAFDSALGTGPVDRAAAALASVGSDLVAADRDYEVFVAMLPAAERGATLPSRWVADPTEWQRPELDAFVVSLRSTASLLPVHDIAVLSLVTDPPPVAREGDSDVLPATRQLRVQVVVANLGNQREERVRVLATVTLPDGSQDSARQFVDLDAGQRQVVRLGGLRVVPGGPVSLVVVAGPLALEPNQANNEVRRTLVFR